MIQGTRRFSRPKDSDSELIDLLDEWPPVVLLHLAVLDDLLLDAHRHINRDGEGEGLIAPVRL